ncbi:MAG: hypothetical protein LUC49_02650 [Prevotella sp.]|nr:hypothetical protein [Prevotella sp.]
MEKFDGEQDILLDPADLHRTREHHNQNLCATAHVGMDLPKSGLPVHSAVGSPLCGGDIRPYNIVVAAMANIRPKPREKNKR